jgi:hypothetical protein
MDNDTFASWLIVVSSVFNLGLSVYWFNRYRVLQAAVHKVINENKVETNA